MIEGKYEIFVCVAKDVPHTVEFFMDNGVMKGIHTTPLGKQMIEDIVYNDYSVSWEAFAGTEGSEVFRNTLLINGNTDEVHGFAVGAAPFFRGFTPMMGKRVKEAQL